MPIYFYITTGATLTPKIEYYWTSICFDPIQYARSPSLLYRLYLLFQYLHNARSSLNFWFLQTESLKQ